MRPERHDIETERQTGDLADGRDSRQSAHETARLDRLNRREANSTTPQHSQSSRGARLWSLAALLCLFASAAFWWLGHIDATFVAAVLGIVAWFLNVRSQLRLSNRDDDDKDARFSNARQHTEEDERDPDDDERD